MVTIKKDLAHRDNYGGKRPSPIKYIVIHYTGNDGDHDESNGNYFNSYRGVSAHYFVDSDSITQSVPDEFVAWHCGTSGTYRHKQCRNNNSIGIELCDDQKNGKVYPSAKTIQNALDLTKSLMKKYNIPAENVIRHYDVTGKKCPAYWVDDAAWKTAFWNRLKDVTGVEKYKKQVKDRFGLSDQTIEYFANYKYADSLFERLATKP